MKKHIYLLVLVCFILISCKHKKEFINDEEVFNETIESILYVSDTISDFYIYDDKNNVNMYIHDSTWKEITIELEIFFELYKKSNIIYIYANLETLGYMRYIYIKGKYILFAPRCSLLSKDGCYSIIYCLSEKESNSYRQVKEYIEIRKNTFVIPNSGLGIE